ncbi:CBS domain-containing protein [Salsuginibacillus kocurii]|uniref:CBS domain-containing protein n=1 Tax=Salsuginibacillus kocurii TaxID=427078 RepID=UPI000373B8C8|nr:CBS domain-containing protein [Salsuginibacillus kocurii]
MIILATHEQADFDALASLVAAKKLYPAAEAVLPPSQQPEVKQFLALYRDSFSFTSPADIQMNNPDHVILVDTAEIERLGSFASNWQPAHVTIYDHHLEKKNSLSSDHYGVVEATGACITILIEKLQKKDIRISSLEATLFGLGLYTDTGSLSYPSTTVRDLQASAFLLANGMNFDLIGRFSEQILSQEEQHTFQKLLEQAEDIELDGLTVLVTTHEQEEYISGLGTLASKLMETTGVDGVFLLIRAGKKTFITARSSSDRLDVRLLMQVFKGGGHARAGSAVLKEADITATKKELTDHIHQALRPALTAEVIMSSPVKYTEEHIRIDEVKELMFRYGHSGLPVVKEGNLIGIISRRDVDKAMHHGLGHAPIKGFMSKDPVSIALNTSLEEIQRLMIQHNIGRLPVVDKETMVGIVSRTNVLEVLHDETLQQQLQQKKNVTTTMNEHFPQPIFQLLKQIGRLADEKKVKAYMIGGIVRDLLLERKNEDIDITIENGDAVEFAEQFANDAFGTVQEHETFKTATVSLERGYKIDFSTARTEYYEQPAALPTVTASNLKEDLSRRDFTINALAIQLNDGDFGRLLDHFRGLTDMKNRKIRVLHNLSFVEDPTRILRAVRFENRLSYSMDEETETFARQRPDSIKLLSHDRILAEFQLILQENDPHLSLQRLADLQVIDGFLPDAGFHHPIPALFQKTEEYIQQQHKSKEKAFSKKEETFFKLLTLYLDYDGKNLPQAKFLSQNKKYHTMIEQIKEWTVLIKSSKNISMGELHTIGANHHSLMLWLCIWWGEATGSPQMSEQLKTYLTAREQLPKLVDGTDLQQLGISQGPIYKELLFSIEIGWLEGWIRSREDAIYWLKQQISS